MTSRELARVEPQLREIIDPFLTQRPVRLGAMAHALGVSILVASMKTGISGQIKREGGTYVIRVNRHEARERQRFTIAHELAHFLLHRTIIDRSEDGITDTVLYRSGAAERVEFEANRLAAELVMPMNLVEDRLKAEYGGVVTEATIEALAADFEVSKAAMEIRLSSFAEV
jgi:Zn-dependent peptidase ImmA (M78 family)